MKMQSELTAGIFLLVALALFSISIWILGSERQIFAKQEEYSTSFADVKGLSEGAHVRLGGISIGRVESITFADSEKDGAVYVTMLINEEYLDRIREDSRVSLQTQGLLGDRFLSISLGKGATAAPGSTLKARETGDAGSILSQAGTVVENTVKISEQLSVVLEKFEEETLENLADSVKNIKSITSEVATGDGVFHGLIYGNQEKTTIVEDLKSTATTLKELMSDIKNREGFLNSLIYDPAGKDAISKLADSAEKIGGSATAIQDIAEEIRDGEGLVHDIIYQDSSQGIGEILSKLNEAADNIKRVTESLAHGGGTLGALLVDSELYDNIVEVTDDAKRSIILRHAIRTSLKKKEETKDRKLSSE